MNWNTVQTKNWLAPLRLTKSRMPWKAVWFDPTNSWAHAQECLHCIQKSECIVCFQPQLSGLVDTKMHLWQKIIIDFSLMSILLYLLIMNSIFCPGNKLQFSIKKAFLLLINKMFLSNMFSKMQIHCLPIYSLLHAYSFKWIILCDEYE